MSGSPGLAAERSRIHHGQLLHLVRAVAASGPWGTALVLVVAAQAGVLFFGLEISPGPSGVTREAWRDFVTGTLFFSGALFVLVSGSIAGLAAGTASMKEGWWRQLDPGGGRFSGLSLQLAATFVLFSVLLVVASAQWSWAACAGGMGELILPLLLRGLGLVVFGTLISVLASRLLVELSSAIVLCLLIEGVFLSMLGLLP